MGTTSTTKKYNTHTNLFLFLRHDALLFLYAIQHSTTTI